MNEQREKTEKVKKAADSLHKKGIRGKRKEPIDCGITKDEFYDILDLTFIQCLPINLCSFGKMFVAALYPACIASSPL